MYSSFSFGEVYRRINGRKFCFTATRPHINVLFNFYTLKTLYYVQNVSFVIDVNHYVDQSLATLLLTSGFPTVYRRIYCR